MDKTSLLSKYAINLSGSKNKAHYLSYAKLYLDYSSDFNKEGIDKFLNKMRKQGKSQGTINFIFRVIRRLYNVNAMALIKEDIEWPYRPGESPQIEQRSEHKPALAPEVISKMIETAKTGDLDAQEIAILALSTTYGLRRGEMARVHQIDIAFNEKTIFIHTEKGGRQRYHLIPDEIIPYLEAYDFETSVSKKTISQIFWRVINKSGMEALQKERLGWHSCRRTLITLLENNGLSLPAVHAFMRWKSSSSDMAMEMRYHATSFVGLDGTTPVTSEAEGDKEIFERHPFLENWR